MTLTLAEVAEMIIEDSEYPLIENKEVVNSHKLVEGIKNQEATEKLIALCNGLLSAYMGIDFYEDAFARRLLRLLKQKVEKNEQGTSK